MYVVIILASNIEFTRPIPTLLGIGTISVVGDWNEERGGTARTEGRDNSYESEPISYGPNSCLEPETGKADVMGSGATTGSP